MRHVLPIDGPTLLAATILAAILAVATPARAQNAEAEGLFREGDKLMSSAAAGDLARACDAFEASNRIESRAGTLIRLGECREKNGQIASAWVAYTDALTRVKDPRKKQIANERATSLEKRLSYLTISVPDESRVDGLTITRNGAAVDLGLWNHALPIDGGRYVVAGKAPAHEEWSTTVEVPSENGRVSVDVPRFKEVKVLLPQPKSDDDDDDDGKGDGRDDDGLGDDRDGVDTGDAGTFTGRRKLALGVAGVGVAALIAGGIFGAQSNGLERDATKLCPNDPCADGDEANRLIDRAGTRATLANIGFGIGGAAIIGAAVLWFTGGPRERSAAAPTALAPRLGPGYAGLDLALTF